jgi:hypothetical protein
VTGNGQTDESLRRGLLLAPPIFVAHFLEESPRFVPWFNAHVARGITPDAFWTVNLTGLVITVVLVAGVWATREEGLLLPMGSPPALLSQRLYWVACRWRSTATAFCFSARGSSRHARSPRSTASCAGRPLRA